MINIHQEVTIDLAGDRDHTLTLWLVSYGSPKEDPTPVIWPAVAELLRRACAQQGWLLECGDDPHNEKSLATFAEGFPWPTDPLADEGQYLPYGEEDEDDWAGAPF